MKRWALASCLVLCAFAFAFAFAGRARADNDGVRRLTVSLDWKHVPRESGEDAPISSQGAVVKGGAVHHRKYRDGSRWFGITYDSGFFCSTMGDRDALIRLTCGSDKAFYYLVQSPGEQTRLEWVWTEAAPAAER